MEHENDVYTNYNWFFWYSHQRINKGTGGYGYKKSNGDHPNYYIVEIGQNTEQSPGNLRRLAVTQIPVNADVKNSKGIIIIIIIIRRRRRSRRRRRRRRRRRCISNR